MARVEEAVRRNNLSSSNSVSTNSLTSSYIDNIIDVSELPTTSVLYELTLSHHINEEEFSNAAIVAVPSNYSNQPKSKTHPRVYFCSECGASFANNSNLKSHFRTHTGEKPFNCRFCGASFIQSSNLKAHMRIHTGEKPYQCNVCGKSFTRSSHLNGHKRIHSLETPYTCTICNKSFNQSNQLRLHMSKHSTDTEHTCGFCEKIFKQKSSLEVHVQIHKGERPFVCCDCSAAFRSKEDLNIHKRLHFGDVFPYICSICGRGFKISLCCTKHTEKCAKERSKNSRPVSIRDKMFKRKLITRSTFTKNENNKPQTYHFPESISGEEVCSMQVVEGSIEDGVDEEVEEHTMVFTNSEEGDSVHHVVPS